MDNEGSNATILQKQYDEQIKQLGKQISIIELRQQELQNYIISLDQSIKQIDRLVNTENQKSSPDYNKIKNLRFINSKNIEMITDIYNTYERFETVKFKYYKEIDNHSHSGNRLIYIEGYKLENQTNDISDSFMEMIKYLSNLKEANLSNPKTPINDEKILDNLNDNPEYQL